MCVTQVVKTLVSFDQGLDRAPHQHYQSLQVASAAWSFEAIVKQQQMILQSNGTVIFEP